MKRIFLALAILALLVPATRQVDAADVSIDFFYNNLNDGNWIEVADYGYCWQPNVVVSNRDWRPYSDGYWAYTDVGWTWVSYEDFGWATYHYGRWARLADEGWVWVPGYEWGPAWVSWRTGGDYVGWAPLPPSRERVYEGRPITSHVDVEFDIGPMYYNFVDIRYIGEPVLRDRIFAPSQNVTYITKTVNVTNITYNNSIVYNHGPDFDRLSRYSTRPIQRLTLQRETNVNFATGFRGNEVNKVQGSTLVVAAPVTIQKAAKNVAPKKVKAKIAQAKLESGWAGISDPKQKTELQQKMKTEDSKQIPPPDIQPTQKGAGAAGPSPAATGAGAISATAATASPAATVIPRSAATATPAVTATPPASPAASPQRRERGRKGEQPDATASPAASVVGEQQPTPERRRGHKGERGERAMPTPAPTAGEATSPAPAEQASPRGRGEGRKGTRGGETLPTPPDAAGRGADLAPEGTQPPSRQKGGRGQNEIAPTPSEPRDLSEGARQGKRGGDAELAPTGQSNAETHQGRRNAPQGRGQAEPPAGSSAGEGKKEGGERKKKGGEPSPSPTAPQ